MRERRRYSASVVGWKAFLVALVGLALGWLAYNVARKEGVSTSRESGAPQSGIAEYVTENPAVGIEAIQQLGTRRSAGATKTSIEANEAALLHDPASPVGGNPQGDVTLVEFFDFNCPYCRRVAPLLADAAAADGKLRIVYKDIPILGSDSVYAAKAALAAQRQGKYVEFYRALLDARGVAAKGLVLAIAGRIGLDVPRLRKDINDPSIQALIDRNLTLARKLGITGTPTFVIGKEVVPGAIDLKTIQELTRRARIAK